MTLELKSLARVKAVVIEWQAAAKSFEVQVASDSGPWSVFASAPHTQAKWVEFTLHFSRGEDGSAGPSQEMP